MQDGYSKSFYFVIFVVLAFFIYLAFTILPDRTKSVFVGEGSSMEPTLEDGAEIVVSSNRTPQVGEIIVFKCNDKCKDFPGEIFTKRLASIDEEGCYWVLGDNAEVSYDSRAFGKLCADDFELYGVVVEVVSNK